MENGYVLANWGAQFVCIVGLAALLDSTANQYAGAIFTLQMVGMAAIYGGLHMIDRG